MDVTLWYIIIGGLLIAMAFGSRGLERLPVTPALLYLIAGIVLGPMALGLIPFDPLAHPAFLERLAEVAIIVSLFAAGLKLRTPFYERRWSLPIRLASVSMLLTVALVAAAGVSLLNLSVGEAVLLGAILAPTDPVLASEVAVAHWKDNDRLRFSLTGEAALNDGTAFPLVMLGLAMLGVEEAGTLGWGWVATHVVWAVLAALALGAVVGTVSGRYVQFLRRRHVRSVALDDFLALGLLALTYGIAIKIGVYGFLAAFALGSGLRRTETRFVDFAAAAGAAGANAGAERSGGGGADEDLPGLAGATLRMVEQLERLFEFGVVLLLGGMLSGAYLTASGWWFVPVLFLVIRPIAVSVGLLGTDATRLQRTLVSWFGIRGIGSLYYLAYAVTHGLPPDTARTLAGLTLTTVAASVAIHGVSVTPLLRRYDLTR